MKDTMENKALVVVGREQVEIVSSQQSEGLQKLLQKLQEQDSFFNYNVPPHMRRTFSEESLFRYLQETYSQKVFVVDDPQEVDRYIQAHDRVMMKEEQVEYEWKVESGVKGRVVKISRDGPTVLFSTGLKLQISPDHLPDFQVYGREGSFWDGECPNDIVYKEPRRADEGTLQDREWLQYLGKGLEKTRFRLPARAEGVVTSLYRRFLTEPQQARIAWAWHPHIQGYTYQSKGYTAELNDAYFSVEKLRLVRPNFINVEQLARECFPGQ